MHVCISALVLRADCATYMYIYIHVYIHMILSFKDREGNRPEQS